MLHVCIISRSYNPQTSRFSHRGKFEITLAKRFRIELQQSGVAQFFWNGKKKYIRIFGLLVFSITRFFMAKRRVSIALATCKKTYETAKDETALHRALQSLNVAIKFPIWSEEEEDWEEYDLVVPRTTWDYQKHFSQFCKWLHIVSQTTRVCNPISTLIWNAHKKYLKDIQTAGIQVIPTAYITNSSVTKDSVRQAVKNFGRTRVLVKPSVGASSSDCMVFDSHDLQSILSHVKNLLHVSQDMVLVQPFSNSVTVKGEYSLMLWGGKPSHGVRKIPSSRSFEFRVQEEHGGTNQIWHDPPEQVVKMSLQACQCAPGGWHYARCDFLNDEKLGWCLIELEMLEPSFYLEFAKETEVERLASLLQKLASQV